MYANAPNSALEMSLSPARLGPYRTFFKAKLDAETLAAFQWNQTVSSALWPLMSLVELAFRNRLHACFSDMYGGSVSNAWYLTPKAQLSAIATNKVMDTVNATDSNGNPICQSVDDVVAEMSFGFWVEALRRVPKDKRWKVSKAIFPNYGPVANKPAWVQAAQTWLPLIGRLERHKSFRDRLAHHRPVWRWRYAPNPGAPLITPSSPGAAMTGIRQEVAQLEQTLREMDNSLLALWTGGLPQRLLSSLTTSVGLHYSLHRPEEIANQIRPFRSPGYRNGAQELQSSGVARLI
jgi:hypothetical protein